MITKFRDIVISHISRAEYVAPLCCVLNKMDIYPEGFICGEHLAAQYDLFERAETYYKTFDLVDGFKSY